MVNHQTLTSLQNLRQQLYQHTDELGQSFSSGLQTHQDFQHILTAIDQFSAEMQGLRHQMHPHSEDELKMIRHTLRNCLNTIMGASFLLQLNASPAGLNAHQREVLAQLYKLSRDSVPIVNELR